MKRSIGALTVALFTVASLPAVADIWVFDPSVTLDQRFDDNYYLSPENYGSLSATRGVGELGLSREAADYVLKGLVRIDALLTTSNDVGSGGLDSNYVIGANARKRTERSRYGVLVNFKQDTPSRDIAADLSDNEAIAEDTGLLVTQSLSSNVARDDITIAPSFEYDLTRRLQLNVEGTFSDVSHALPDSNDVVFERYNESYPATLRLEELIRAANRDDNPDNDQPEGVNPCIFYSEQEAEALGDPSLAGQNRPLLSYDQVTANDPCVGVFSPNGELDDYQELEAKVGLRYKFTPIVTLTAAAAVSRLNAQVLASSRVEFGADNLWITDDDVSNIKRTPRRDQISTTAKITLGYERFLTPTLQFVVDGGIYTNTTDDSDTYREGDRLKDNQEAPDVGKKRVNGWLASTTLTYDAGATRYSGRFAVDVQPSSAGTQVETNELTGDVTRSLSPRLMVSLKARAFEPDRVGGNANDRFARRFISFEPRVQWRYTRNWTVSAAYRYRRQKARVDFRSAESNAILLAIKYTPPSELRDTARANGL